jgi:hypothetical protein
MRLTGKINHLIALHLIENIIIRRRKKFGTVKKAPSDTRYTGRSNCRQCATETCCENVRVLFLGSQLVSLRIAYL